MVYARRDLTDREKETIKNKSNHLCFVCSKTFIPTEKIEYDHIKSLKACEKEGISEEQANNLDNFAAVHKLCNRRKSSENLNDIRDKFRIESNFNEDFDKIYPHQKSNPEIHIDYAKMIVRFDGEDLKLYQCPNTKLYYFFHAIPMKYLKKDVEIQPRVIYKNKLIELAKHLKNNFQLSASACRLKGKEILLFDGQHKSAAQHLGNENKRIECKVIIDPTKLMVDNVIERAHGDLRQMAFKSSELGKKIMNQYKSYVERWERKNPGRIPSEKDIFRGELGYSTGKANSAIVQMYAEMAKGDVDCDIGDYISKTKTKDKPMTDNMFNTIVKCFLLNQPLEFPIGSELDNREEELKNLVTILNFIVEHTLKNKWNPEQPNSAEHKLANNLYREAPMEVWVKMISDALRLLLRKRTEDGICYSSLFTEEQKDIINRVIKKTFEHPAWQNPALEPEFKTRDNAYLEKRLKENGLDYISIMRP